MGFREQVILKMASTIDAVCLAAYPFFTGGASDASTHDPQASVSSQLAGRHEGPADAYRHLLISAELTRRFDEEYARLALWVHEDGETGASTTMDVYNNEIGIAIGKSVRNSRGTWEDIIPLAQEVMVKSLADFTYQDIVPSADWQQQLEGNLVLQRTFRLSNDITVPAISLQKYDIWAKNPVDNNEEPIDTQDCNWPTTDGSWLTRFVPESYVYKGGTQIIQLELSSLQAVKSSNVAAKVVLEDDVVKIQMYQAFGNRRLSAVSSLPDDIDIHLSKLFSQVAAATARSEQEALQALPLVVAGQTEEKFLYIGTDAAEAFNLIPGSQTAEGGTVVYTLGGDDEIGINGGNNTIDGGDGVDTLSYANAGSGVDVDLSAGNIITGNGASQVVDTIINVEAIIGSDHNDAFRGTMGANSQVSFAGGKGDDRYALYSSDQTRYSIADSEGSNILKINGQQLTGTASPVTNREEGTTFTLKSQDENLYVLTRVNEGGVVSSDGMHLQVKPATDVSSNAVTLLHFEEGQFGIKLTQEKAIGDVEDVGSSVDYYYVSTTPFANGNVFVTYNSAGNLYGKIVDADGKAVAAVAGTLPINGGSPTATLRNGNVMIVGNNYGTGTKEVSIIAPDGSIVVDKKAIALDGSLSWDPLACREDGKVAVSHGNAISLLDQETGEIAHTNFITLGGGQSSLLALKDNKLAVVESDSEGMTLQVFDQNGSPIQAKNPIGTVDTYFFSHIASSEGDRVIFTGKQDTANSDIYNIITKSFDIGGNEVASHNQQISNVGGYPYIVSASLPGNNTLVVTEQGLNPDGSDNKLRGQLLSSSLIPLGDDFDISPDNTGTLPRIAATGDGNVLTFWLGWGETGYEIQCSNVRTNAILNPSLPTLLADSASPVLTSGSGQTSLVSSPDTPITFDITPSAGAVTAIYGFKETDKIDLSQFGDVVSATLSSAESRRRLAATASQQTLDMVLVSGDSQQVVFYNAPLLTQAMFIGNVTVSGVTTESPTSIPSGNPSGFPTSEPSTLPSGWPSGFPSSRPNSIPSGEPTGIPSLRPNSSPSGNPSGFPTSEPSTLPSGEPSGVPSSRPNGIPSGEPTGIPSLRPNSSQSGNPSGFPTSEPSTLPSGWPSGVPSSRPNSIPSGEPTGIPSLRLNSSPSGRPSMPSNQPIASSYAPSNALSYMPSFAPSLSERGVQGSDSTPFIDKHKVELGVGLGTVALLVVAFCNRSKIISGVRSLFGWQQAATSEPVTNTRENRIVTTIEEGKRGVLLGANDDNGVELRSARYAALPVAGRKVGSRASSQIQAGATNVGTVAVRENGPNIAAI